MKNLLGVITVAVAILVWVDRPSYGQGYGTNLQNLMTPAAGGMAGVSIAQPQDVPAAIFGNPASLTQFKGTQFTLGGAWLEGYPTIPTTARPIWRTPEPRSASRRGPQVSRLPRWA